MEPKCLDELQKKFGIRTDAVTGSYSIELRLLLHDEEAKRFLDEYNVVIRGEDRAVAAVFCAGWLSKIALGLQYAISVWQIAPDFSIPNMTLHWTTNNHKMSYFIEMSHWQAVLAPENEVDRRGWLESVMERFYFATARPLLESLSAASGLHIQQLWGQWPTRFYREHQTWLEEQHNEAIKNRLHEDYRFLREELDPEAAFARKKNPFAVKIRPLPPLVDPDYRPPMKTACCLYYRTEGSDYCYTCPRLNEQQREVKRKEYIAMLQENTH